VARCIAVKALGAAPAFGDSTCPGNRLRLGHGTCSSVLRRQPHRCQLPRRSVTPRPVLRSTTHVGTVCVAPSDTGHIAYLLICRVGDDLGVSSVGVFDHGRSRGRPRSGPAFDRPSRDSIHHDSAAGRRTEFDRPCSSLRSKMAPWLPFVAVQAPSAHANPPANTRLIARSTEEPVPATACKHRSCRVADQEHEEHHWPEHPRSSSSSASVMEVVVDASLSGTFGPWMRSLGYCWCQSGASTARMTVVRATAFASSPRRISRKVTGTAASPTAAHTQNAY
jgi:hypothetical protein